MDNTALKIDPVFESVELSAIRAPANVEIPQTSPLFSLPTVACVLIALQILDGVLTLTGMFTFGVTAEGNPLLRELMRTIGLVPALVVTKLGCIGLVMALCWQAARVEWLRFALSFVAFMYATCAVLPWSIILASTYLG